MSAKVIDTGICDYCGQVVTVSDAKPRTEKEADEAAKLRCTCLGGVRARRTKSLGDKIAMMFAEGCEDHFEDFAPVSDEALSMIRDIAAFCLDGTATAISAVLESGDSVKVKRSSEGEIVIMRKHSADASVKA